MKKLKFIVIAGMLLSVFACLKTDKKNSIPPSGIAGTHSRKSEISSFKSSKIIKNNITISGIITQILIKKKFSYIEINQKNSKKIWIALINTKAKVGEKILVKSELMLKGFKSKALNRTFTRIYFGHILKPYETLTKQPP